MTRNILKSSAVGIFCLLVFSAFSFGLPQEEEEARLEGKILDTENKPLAEVDIQLKNLGTNQLLTVKSNKKGEFAFRLLFPAKYVLTAGKEGYKTHSLELELNSDSTKKLVINLAKELSSEEKMRQEAVSSFQKGVELAKEDKIDEAVGAFRTATDLNPDFTEAYINLGLLLFRQAKDEEAEKALLKALELKSEEPKIKTTLGSIYFEKAKTLLQSDKIDEALEQLKISYSYDPGYSYTSYLLGYAFYKKGIKEEAIKYFEAFLQMEPNSPQAPQVKEILESLKKQ